MSSSLHAPRRRAPHGCTNRFVTVCSTFSFLFFFLLTSPFVFQPPRSIGTTVMMCAHEDVTTITAAVAQRGATTAIMTAMPHDVTTATTTAFSAMTATATTTPHGATMATVTPYVAWDLCVDSSMKLFPGRVIPHARPVAHPALCSCCFWRLLSDTPALRF